MLENYYVSDWVRDLVALAFWAPPAILFNAVALGALGAALRYAFYGETVDLAPYLAQLDGQTQLILMAAIGGFYFLLANATFTTEVVDETIENAEDMQETAEDIQDGDSE